MRRLMAMHEGMHAGQGAHMVRDMLRRFSFVLASLVVGWGGWPFVSSAARSLRQRELTMMTLIATGILVSYVYSAAVTFGLRGEPFYDAAAMLTAFSLLGHWMEMRSRFATGRAVEARLP